ncbi:hypothetical protein PR003_g7203 [Phytophthora rubi]|uniref:Uncharacterized protein n=2 Tax=Phytophthora TaxID=4783 RepID=A0A6A3N6W8_9STRA|nr:hypothetical protein PR002_g7075 [Phytophthora rubi]KAE9041215.1 hypothetical protein PR001_g6721 [Phytophthora rubi]KAE9320685.1 hypothetical protein PF008_g17987 [Phytophthora fragariae]KAE9346920.1 hypothetical protein PR003_g7203 [Phytophthora rubi]
MWCWVWAACRWSSSMSIMLCTYASVLWSSNWRRRVRPVRYLSPMRYGSADG